MHGFLLSWVNVVFLTMACLAISRSDVNAIYTSASSNQESGVTPQLAMDGNMQTRWSSQFSDPQWFLIDFQSSREIVGLTLFWEAAYGKAYDILVSQDNSNWRKVYSTDNGDGSVDDIYFGKKTCRYVKMNLRQRGTAWGYSLWEISVKSGEDEIMVTTGGPGRDSAEKIFDGDAATAVNIPEGPGSYLQFSSKKAISFGALLISWGADYASSYSLDISADGKNWKTLFEKKDGSGGREAIPVNVLAAKYVRLSLRKSNGGKGYAISEISFKSWKEMSMKSGLDQKRTIVGVEGYEWVTFAGCDGTFAPEPFPYQAGFWLADETEKRIFTPETMPVTWKLKEGRFPVSVSEWEQDGLKYVSTIFANKPKALNRMMTFDRITITNKGKNERALSLLMVLSQNPLCVKWNTSLADIQYDGSNLIRINGRAALFMKTKPSAGTALDQAVNTLIKARMISAQARIPVDAGNQGAIAPFKFNLKPGEERSFDFYAVSGETDAPSVQSVLQLDFTSNLDETIGYWKKRATIELDVPDKTYTDCFYSSIYYMLVMMKGDGLLYPGAYSYKSYFLHDAVEMGGALDKAGIHDVALKATRHFNTKTYGGYGDELGGSIFGYYEHYRITKDTEYLRRVFPLMLSGCELIRQLRRQQMTPQFVNTPSYGLVPKSVSQDNFTIPAYLYVDDWWAVMGLKSAAEAAKILNAQNASWVMPEYESLLKCTLDSINKVMQQEKLNYMTGFADYWPPSMRKIDAEHRILGDTQMAWAHRAALFPGQSLGVRIPTELFQSTYKHYWENAGKFSNYDGGWFVEYEGLFWGYNVQLAHPMMMLGMEDITLKNIEWSLNHQNCPGGWCEAMNTTVNSKGFREVSDGIIGDVPHGWTAAYYVHLLRNMIFREENDKLVLLGCVPKAWLAAGKHISVKNAPTYFGMLNFEAAVDNTGRQLNVKIGLKLPPKDGYRLNWPLDSAITSVEVDGVRLEKFGQKPIELPPNAKNIIIKY